MFLRNAPFYSLFLVQVDKYFQELMDTMHIEVSSTAMLFKKYELIVYKHLREELDVKYRKKKVLGKEVVLNFIVNDFMFWFETEK